MSAVKPPESVVNTTLGGAVRIGDPGWDLLPHCILERGSPHERSTGSSGT